MKNLLRASVLIVAGTLLLTGCGSNTEPNDSTDTATPAAQQALLHIYNWTDYVAEDTISEFERRTGIRVVYDRTQKTRLWMRSCVRVTRDTIWFFHLCAHLHNSTSSRSCTPH